MNPLIILLVVILIFMIFLYRKRKSYYPYDVTKDYQYSLVKSSDSEIKKGELVLPITQPNSTIIAKVYVKSGFLGYFKQPYIEISSNGKTLKQYMEHGAKGYRYLNLSNFAGEKKVILSGNNLSVKNEKVDISIYETPISKDSKILVIAPHPDDAEIAAYGLYSKYAKNVFVLTMSAGERGKFKYRELYDNEKEQHLKKGEIRTWNALTVPLLAGVPTENVLMFGYFNEMLDDMYEQPNQNFGSDKLETDDVDTFQKFNFSSLAKNLKKGANWESLIENTKYVIEDFQPDIIISPYPYIDGHEDHKYSTIAVMEALKTLDYQKGSLLLYTNHYTDMEYYPIGKIGSVMSLPQKFDNSIYFESLFSFSLDKTQQNDKILAFDAMNDLRPNTEYRFWYRLFADGFTRGREKLFSIEKDYFNRYIRSNELFYVIPIKEIYNSEIEKAIVEGKDIVP